MVRSRHQASATVKTIRLSSAVLLTALAFAGGLLLGSLSTSFQASPPRAGSSGQAQAPASAGSAAGGSDETKAHIVQIEQMTREQPTNAKLWIHLADAYYDANDPIRAIPAYERGLALNPDNLDARTDLGTMYRLSGQFDKSLELYNDVITRNPRHRNARFNKGVVLYNDLGRKQEGVDAWNALLSVMPDARGPDGQPLSDFIARHPVQ